ncbi:M-phase phosphoprotein 6-like [Antedon mediterranea]|uniref:M-phase phosphoprotein 6-like n=1 Tax=Antedon mediterranea TaxID=105859 RepID=UPI003AF6F511
MAAQKKNGQNKSQISLSKNVKQMKFMQRKLDRDIVEESKEQDRQHKIDDEHWVLDLPELQHKTCKYEIEASYVKCEDLMYGRMSFKGMDPIIEKIMKNNETRNEEEEEEEEAIIDPGETMITDEEMAKQYSTLVNTIGKKFAKKRDMSTDKSSSEEHVKRKKKKGFLKPNY